jgi:hypothetical protein
MLNKAGKLIPAILQVGVINRFLALQIGLQDAIRAVIGTPGMQIEIIIPAGNRVRGAGAGFWEIPLKMFIFYHPLNIIRFFSIWK